MRITVDARELRTTSGRYVERLLHYLQKIDTTNHYTILLKPPDMEGWQPSNPHFNVIAAPQKEFTFAEQFSFMSLIRSTNPDLVFFPFAQQPVLYRGRVVTTIQDLTALRFNNPSKNPVLFKVKQVVYGLVVKRVARRSSTIITPSQFVKDDVVAYAGIDPNNVVVTLESADPITHKAEPVSAVKNAKYIMYVGRPQPHKNLSRLIDAFALLQKTHPDLKLVLAGKKDVLFDAHEADVQKRKLSGVIFTGFVSEGQLRWLYEHTQAYVFPSLSEGFGLPGLEAALCGAPVVASNASCLPEVYGEGAYYFDPLDPQDIADKVGHILDDPKLRTHYVAAGKKQAAKYSWERMAKQTLAVFEAALKKP